MHVREQHVILAWFASALARELVAELAHPGPRIDDDGLTRRAARLDARRLPAVPDRGSARHGVAPPNPPEGDFHVHTNSTPPDGFPKIRVFSYKALEL